MKLVLSQDSLFHLSRLGVVVFGKTRRKYKLSVQQDMLSLIRYCDESQDVTINRQYDAFIYSLNPAQHAELEAFTRRRLPEHALRSTA